MSITAYMSDPEELHVAVEENESLAATVDPPIGSGTNDHRKLSNRDADNQHPISAIEGLQRELDSKLGTSELNAAIDQALTEAKESGAFKGEKGDTGPQGERGIQGEAGPQGEQGIQGEKGEPGKDGAKGEQGEQGPQGEVGPAGADGKDGQPGATGPQGEQGPKGDKGDTGAQGPPGEKGEQGPPGADGAKGDKGDTGPQGPKGDTGPTGPQGPQGDKGEKGDTGATGTSVSVKSVSESSADGGSNIVTFSDGKTITIKNGSKGSKGDTGDPGSPGADGPPGADGERGTGILKVTTSPTSYTTSTGGKNPIKRMSISTIKTQASVDEVLVGDCISYSYYLYHIYYLDATYAYMDTYQSIRGATGAAGAAGADGQPGADGKDYVLTDADKEDIAEIVSGDVIPEYWKTHISDKIETINGLHQTGGKDCFSFPLLTDIHIRQNLGKYSGVLAKRILDECYLPFALCTGDIVNRGSEGEADMDKDFITAEALLKPIRDKLLQTQGNHDGAWGYKDYNSDGTMDYYAYNFKPEKRHALIYRKVGLVGDCHFDDSGTGYWIDDVSNKVRYIILNTHNNPYAEDADGFAVYNTMWEFKLQQSQFDMVEEALSSVPGDGWAVVSASHVPLNQSNLANLALMAKVFNAYKTKTTFTGSYAGEFDYDAIAVNVDFSSAKGEYIGHFAGHSHIDTAVVYNGISVFTTRCDGQNEPSDSGLTKTAGTVTEQSFDVFTVNRKDKKIYVTKIGAGSNRYWDYGKGEAFNPDAVIYAISASLSNCTGASGNVTKIAEGGNTTLTFTANSGYELPASVTVSGATYSWDQSAGTLVLSNPTGNVSISIVATVYKAYTNVLPLAQQYSSTAPYIGADGSVGYANNMRISTSSASATYMKALTGVDTTALIPVKRGDVLRFKNCNLKVTPANTSYGTYMIGYNSSKAVVSAFNFTYSSLPNRLPIVTDGDEIVQITLEPLSGWLPTSNVDQVAYIMIATDGLDETSVITINEEITD